MDYSSIFQLGPRMDVSGSTAIWRSQRGDRERLGARLDCQTLTATATIAHNATDGLRGRWSYAAALKQFRGAQIVLSSEAPK